MVTKGDGTKENVIVPKDVKIDEVAKLQIEKQCPDVAEFRILKRLVSNYDDCLENAKASLKAYGTSAKQSFFPDSSDESKAPLNPRQSSSYKP